MVAKKEKSKKQEIEEIKPKAEEDRKRDELARRRLKDGWIKSNMMIEVLAVREEVTKQAIENHIAKMEKEKNTMVVAKDFKPIKRVENPLPRISEAYSAVADLDVLTQNFQMLVYLVMKYAPSSVEVMEPAHLKIGMGEAQNILNIVAEMMHKFARAGIGGVVISPE